MHGYTHIQKHTYILEFRSIVEKNENPLSSAYQL